MNNKILLGLALLLASLATGLSNPTPIAVWSGDGTATDSINGNVGTLLNGATYGAGRWGQAFSLDGQNDVVIVPNSPTLNAPGVSDRITLSLWLKWSGNTSQWGVLPVLRKASSNNNNTYTIDVLNSGKVGISISDGTAGGTQATQSPGVLSSGRWYHVSGTYDGALLKLYVDGVLVASKATSVNIGVASGQLYIGRDEYAGTWFGGMIDQVEIYDQALTATEVYDRYLFNLPPIANAGSDRIEYVGTNSQASIVLSGALSSDPEGGALTYVWSGPFGIVTGEGPTVTLPLGIHEVELDVTDEYNQTATTMIHIAVVQGVSVSAFATLQSDLNNANTQITSLATTNQTLIQQNNLLQGLLQTLKAKFEQIKTIAIAGIAEIDAATE